MVLNPVGIRQRERGLWETARLLAEEYPKVNQLFKMTSMQMTDCLSEEENVEKALKKADELELMLNNGFTLK